MWGWKSKRKRKVGRVHVNRYAHLAGKSRKLYSAENKMFRMFVLLGTPGYVYPEGFIYFYHGRRYRLREAVKICPWGLGVGNFRLEFTDSSSG